MNALGLGIVALFTMPFGTQSAKNPYEPAKNPYGVLYTMFY
jgi:hypothetical protein